MLFSWDVYDNPGPFDRIDKHSDNFDELLDFYKDEGHCGQKAVIFDRVQGRTIPENYIESMIEK